MPRGDRTGPEGKGSMTGRGQGFCSGYNRPGYAGPVRSGLGLGRGFGRGTGFGRGAGRRMNAKGTSGIADERTLDQRSELQVLKDEAQLMKEDLDVVMARIHELEKA